MGQHQRVHLAVEQHLVDPPAPRVEPLDPDVRRRFERDDLGEVDDPGDRFPRHAVGVLQVAFGED
jgi:hypothetical protein